MDIIIGFQQAPDLGQVRSEVELWLDSRRVCYVLLRWFRCTTPWSVYGVRVVLRRRCSGTNQINNYQ